MIDGGQPRAMLVSFFCREHAALVGGPFTTCYDARQLVPLHPEGDILRESSSQAGVSDPPRTGT
jgi:hypothetical protein